MRSQDIQSVIEGLREKKESLNFYGEIKWQKITENYKEKYSDLMDYFFELISQDKIKIRIMFTNNNHTPLGLTSYHKDNKYFILYYEFIKHAFGLRYCNETDQVLRIRLYLDRLPDTKEKAKNFKSFLSNLSKNPQFSRSKILIPEENIAEVDSHKHEVLQCLDVVLGSIQFRLNEKHLEKIPGTNRRGNRTRAKEYVYRSINRNIRKLYLGFNIGITTGVQGDITNRWKHGYRHWQFIPSPVKFR